MKKIQFIILCGVLCSVALAAPPTFVGSNARNKTTKVQPFDTKSLIETARKYLFQNKAIAQKHDIATLLNQLEKSQHVALSGNDSLRTRFVNAQGCIEQALVTAQEKGEIIQVIGMIHTPAPASPLCTKPLLAEQSDPNLSDPTKLLPAQSRCSILRSLLDNGNLLYVLYPDGGLEKRSSEQQNIYVDELKKHPNLIDWVLTTEKMDPDMIGATYFFQNNMGSWLAFSVKGRHAADDTDLIEWGLWLGEIKNPVIVKRIDTLFKYLKTCNGPSQNKFFPVEK